MIVSAVGCENHDSKTETEMIDILGPVKDQIEILREAARGRAGA